MANARRLTASDQTAQHVGPTFAHCVSGLFPGRLVAREGKHPSSIDRGSMHDVFVRRVQISTGHESFVQHAT